MNFFWLIGVVLFLFFQSYLISEGYGRGTRHSQEKKQLNSWNKEEMYEMKS